MSDRYGVVVFDGDRANTGWSSIEGGPPNRVNGLGDLRTDVLWWTSLEYDQFYKAGLSRHSYLRESSFLRTKMTLIRDEAGLSGRHVKTFDVAQALSKIFSKVMHLSDIAYNFPEYTRDKLCEDIRDQLIPPDYSITSEIDKACQEATQFYVKCIGSLPKGVSIINFRTARMDHAAKVLSTPIPGDRWEYIERKKLPEKKLRLEWVINNPNPILAEIVIISIPDDIMRLISFGNSNRKKRKWVAQPELLLLSRYAEIEIDSVFMFSEYQPLKTKYPAPISKGFSSLSLSAGLLAENHWVGLCSPESSKNGKIFSPRTAWFRSSDIVMSFIPALALHNAGIFVNGYGAGNIVAGVQRGNIAEAIAIASSAGLVPPMTAPEDAIIQMDLSQ